MVFGGSGFIGSAIANEAANRYFATIDFVWSRISIIYLGYKRSAHLRYSFCLLGVLTLKLTCGLLLQRSECGVCQPARAACVCPAQAKCCMDHRRCAGPQQLQVPNGRDLVNNEFSVWSLIVLHFISRIDRSHLEKTKAVVVSIGAPPIPYADEEKQITMNGRTNAEVCSALIRFAS